MVRVLLDSNAFDAIALDDATLALVEKAIQAGQLELVVTHIQIDEVSATPDEARRSRLLRLSSTANTVTAGFVFDVSRLDYAALMSEDEVAIYDRVTAGNVRHAEDALLLLTAKREGIAIVTDERRLPNQCRAEGVTAWTPSELLAMLDR